MLIVIEGIDGAGKGTQVGILQARLRVRNKKVHAFSFPRYDVTSGGGAIGQYLNGKFGDPVSVHPQLASLLYALDRFESRNDLRAQIAVQDVVVCDRYVPSNLAHQCAKLNDTEGEALCQWINEIEYDLYELPVPDLIIQLDLPVELAAKLIAKKARRSYTDRKQDGHEADLTYLANVRKWYDKLEVEARTRCDRWVKIQVDNLRGDIRPVEHVAADIWNEVVMSCPDI